MEKVLKTAKITLSLIVILMLILSVGITMAENSEEIKIVIGEAPNVDIVLSKGETALDLTNFETDLKAKLQQEGVDLSKISIKSIESETVDASQEAGAEQIYNTWTKVGRLPGSWAVDSTAGTITNSDNTYDLTGYIYPDNYYENITVEFEARGIPTTSGTWDEDMFGALIRYRENADGTVSTYLFLIGGNSGGYSAVNQYSAGGYKGNFYTGLYKIDHGAGEKGSFTLSSTKGYKRSGQNSTLAPLATSTKHWSQNTWASYKFVTEGNNIKIYMNNELIIDYTDTDNPIMEGSYGLTTISQEAQYRNFKVQSTKIKTLKDIIQEPEWRTDSLRFLINVEDKANEKYNDNVYLANVASKLINDEVKFVAWGTNANKTQMEKIINNNSGNGIYEDNTAYQTALENTVKYIKEEIEKYESTSYTKDYVLVGTDHKIVVEPEEIRSGTIDKLYTEGKWKVNHDYTHFENNNGQYKLTQKYTDSLIEYFDKVGKYEIIYKKDKVVDAYVHRKPVALFNANVDGTIVTLENLSYDLDEQSNNNGISEEEWSYKKVEDTDWTMGQPTALEENTTYMIRLRVKDHQNTWSEYETKYATTEESEPIACFQIVNLETSIYEKLEVLDTSYDPAGKTITNRLWTLTRISDGKVLYTGATAPEDFSTYGVGEYKLTLVVTNEDGVKSEEYKQSFKIVNDEIAPEIIVDKKEASALSEIKVNVEFTDAGGSGYNSFKYAITDSVDPVTTWSADNAASKYEFTMDQLGAQYIHIIARDNAGNETEEIILGPYVIEPQQFEIEIEKYDISDPNIKLGGVEFSLEQPTSPVYTISKKTEITDSEGKAKLIADVTNAGTLTYTLIEETTLSSYEKLGDIALDITFDKEGNITSVNEYVNEVEVEITDPEHIKLKIGNNRKTTQGNITVNIVNTDELNVGIENSKYSVTIEDAQANTMKTNVITDANGIASLVSLPCEELIYLEIQQTEAGFGYIVDENVYTIGVRYDAVEDNFTIDSLLTSPGIDALLDSTTKELTIYFKNDKKEAGQKLQLTLRDKTDPNMVISDEEFKVSLPYKSGNFYVTTDANGKFEISLISPGEGEHLYTITPESTNTEYKLDPINIIITFDKDGKAINVVEQTNVLESEQIITEEIGNYIFNCVDLLYLVDIDQAYGTQKFRIETQDFDYNVKKIPGAKYKIQIETESGTKTTVRETDSLGEITLDLPKAPWVKLTIEQLQTIPGYILEPSIKEIMLREGTDPLATDLTRLQVDTTETTLGLNIKEKGERRIITFIHDNLAKLSTSTEVQGNIDFYITKKDATTKKLLGNVTFELEETTTGVKHMLTTDRNGYVELHDIHIPGEGKYEFKIHEISTVTGYALPDTEIVMDVIYENINGELKTSGIVVKKGYKYIEYKEADEYEDSNVYQLDFTMTILNNAKPVEEKFTLLKIGSDGKNMANVKFDITVEYPDGTSVKSLSRTKLFGAPEVSGIELDMFFEEGLNTIRVKETSTLKGYKLDTTEKVIVVKKEKGILSIDTGRTTSGLDVKIDATDKGHVILNVVNDVLSSPPGSGGGGSSGVPVGYDFVIRKTGNGIGLNPYGGWGGMPGNCAFSAKFIYPDGTMTTQIGTVTAVHKVGGYWPSSGYVLVGINFGAKYFPDGDTQILIQELSTFHGYEIDSEEKIVTVRSKNGVITILPSETTPGLPVSTYKTIGNVLEVNFYNKEILDTTFRLYKYNQYGQSVAGATFEVQVEKPDGTIDKKNYRTYDALWRFYGAFEKGLDLQQGKTTIRVTEVKAAPGHKLDSTEKVIVVNREGDNLTLVNSECTPGLGITISSSPGTIDKMISLSVVNEKLPNGSNNPNTPPPFERLPYGVYITKVNAYDYRDQVYGAQFKLTLKNSDGNVLRTMYTNTSHRHYESDVYTEAHAGIGWDTGKLTLEIEEVKPGYGDRLNYKLNTNKYVVVFERNYQGVITIDKANSSKGINLGVSVISWFRMGRLGDKNYRCITMTIPNEPAYNLMIQKANEKNVEMLVSGAGFSIIEAEKEFDPDATAMAYGVTKGGSFGVAIKDQAKNTTKRYVIKEEVLPNGFNRMGKYGKALVDITTDSGGYVSKVEIVEKDGYDGKDVCDVVYFETRYFPDDPAINKKYAIIRIKDMPIPEPTYTVKVVKEDEDNSALKLPGATFDVHVESESTTTFTWPVEGMPPYPITTVYKGGVTTDTSITTDSKGVATSTGNLGTGENVITITETKASDGYLLPTESVQVVINREVTAVSTVDKGIIKTGHLSLNEEKTDDDIEVTIDDAKQEVIVTLKNKAAYGIQIEKVDEYDNLLRLQGANFTLEREVFYKDNDGNWKSETGTGVALQKINLPATTINGITGYDEGVMIANKLVEYTLREVKAPYHYTQLEPEIKFRIEYGEDSNMVAAELITDTENVDMVSDIAENKVKLTVKNKLLYDVEIEKVDEKDVNKKLAGAEFELVKELFAQDSKGNWQKIKYINDEDNKPIDLKPTTPNGITGFFEEQRLKNRRVEYTIKERVAPDNYMLMSETIKVRVEYGDDLEVTNAELLLGHDYVELTVDKTTKQIKLRVKNTEMYDIEIQKVDSEDDKLFLPDVEFTMHKTVYSKGMSGNWILEPKDPEVEYSIDLDPTALDGLTGYIEEQWLPNKMVEYTLDETLVPENYEAPKEPLKFRVEYDEYSNVKDMQVISGSKYLEIIRDPAVGFIRIMVKNYIPDAVVRSACTKLYYGKIREDI